MTTAVVAALLSYLGVVNLSSDSGAHQENLDVVHIIAQMAQGKVGSGFDVSSAVYGSHRYVRFSPQLISSSQVLSSLSLSIYIYRYMYVYVYCYGYENVVIFLSFRMHLDSCH